MSYSLRPHGLYSPWNSPGQNTGVGCLSLLQGIFPTQGSKPGLPHCRWILYQLSHQGSPNTSIQFSSAQSLSRVRLSVTLWTVGRQIPLCMGFSGKNTGVGCLALLQGIFPTQGSKPGLPHCGILYCSATWEALLLSCVRAFINFIIHLKLLVRTWAGPLFSLS